MGQNSVQGAVMILTPGSAGLPLPPTVLPVPSTTLSWSKSPWTPHCLKGRSSCWSSAVSLASPNFPTVLSKSRPAPHCPALSDSQAHSPPCPAVPPPASLLLSACQALPDLRVPASGSARSCFFKVLQGQMSLLNERRANIKPFSYFPPLLTEPRAWTWGGSWVLIAGQ